MSKPFEPFVFRGYQFLRILGKGTYSTTYEVFSLKYQTKFCAKATKCSDNVLNPDDIAQDSELISLMSLNHSHVIRIYNFFSIENYLISILQFCEGGNLQNYIDEHGPLSPKIFTNTALKIASAVHYCHKKGIAHRDIKPSNILISHDEPFLADFGLSSFVKTSKDPSQSYPCGTPIYAAPEVFSDRPYDLFKADVWSLGVTFYQMATGSEPFSDEVIEKHKQNPSMIEFPEFFPQNIKSLIFGMLLLNPDERVSMDQVMQNPLFHISSSLSNLRSNSFRMPSRNPKGASTIKALSYKIPDFIQRQRSNSTRVSHPSRKFGLIQTTFSD